MSCWSRYARFSGVSFVLVRYMSATLFMSCSIWLYLSLISVNLPDASPESWWMSMLECLVMNLLSPHIDIREADDAAYPSTNVCTSVSMYLMRSHMYRVGIREPPELVMCIDMGFVVLVSSLSCLAMLSHCSALYITNISILIYTIVTIITTHTRSGITGCTVI